MNEEIMYHIGLARDVGTDTAIICGDPARVEKIARLMDEPEFVASNREYTTWAAKVDNKRVLVVSHGIGGPSTAICLEELYMVGIRTVIRVGTCGGMAMDVKTGDAVIAQSTIRAEGTSREYLPIEFPATANFEVTSALASAAKKLGRVYHVGVVQCKDSFYGQHSPESMPVGDELMAKWNAWIKGGCLASEMESATVYTVAAVRGMRAGCVLRSVWNQERASAGFVDVDSDGGDALSAAKIAVEAVRILLA